MRWKGFEGDDSLICQWGRSGRVRPISASQLKRRNGDYDDKQYTDNAANGQEPNHDCHSFRQSRGVWTGYTIHSNLPEEVKADIEIKHGTDANGAKKAHEESLLLFFDLSNMPVHRVNNGYASKKKNQYAEKDKSVDWNNVIVTKQCPWTDTTEIYKDRQVEQHVNCWL